MITDDELILYYYRDGLDADERARIGAAISNDPQLAQRLQSLVAHLDAAAAMPEVPVPADVQQRWKSALDRAAYNDGVRTARAPRTGRFSLHWSMAAAAAVAVVAITLVVRTATHPSQERVAEVPAPAPAAEAAATTETPAYERGLKFHLASTEQRLAGLGSAKPEERARLVETITAQNRMYALAADRAGEPQLARVLRAFDPILESLAREGGDNTANIAQLSFELRVMQGRLKAGADTPSTTL